jgi:hypothetical protein
MAKRKYPIHHETAYDRAHEATPEELRKRAARGRARYWMVKHYGAKALQDKEVDHIKALAAGGAADDPKNLRLRDPSANRADKTY